jgi:hypothetical protein
MAVNSIVPENLKFPIPDNNGSNAYESHWAVFETTPT